MKVKELIEALNLLNPELMVVIDGYEGGVNEADMVEVVPVALDVNDEWYYGQHEVVDHDEEARYEGYTVVQAAKIV